MLPDSFFFALLVDTGKFSSGRPVFLRTRRLPSGSTRSTSSDLRFLGFFAVVPMFLSRVLASESAGVFATARVSMVTGGTWDSELIFAEVLLLRFKLLPFSSATGVKLVNYINVINNL